MITGNGAIEAGSGDDLVEIGDNATINGLIDGGSGNDTLRFSKAVPAADLAGLQSALATADPVSDSITINGETYTWEDFEIIEDNLKAADPVANIPSLQFWGMLLLIGLVLLFTRQAIRQARQS